MDNIINQDTILENSENITEEPKVDESPEINPEETVTEEKEVSTSEEQEESSPEVYKFSDEDKPTDIVSKLAETFDTDEDKSHFEDFMKSGDIKDLPEDLIVAHFGEEGLIKIQAAIPKAQAEQEAYNKSILSDIYEKVCSKEEWDKIRVFANEELGEDKLNVYKKQLAKGGSEAVTAAEALRALYISSPHTTTTQGKPLEGDRRMTKQGLTKPENYISQTDAAKQWELARQNNEIIKQEELKQSRLESMQYEKAMAKQMKEQEVINYAREQGVNI